ncbi:SDR family oxidoreductase [Ulvibacter antarcticus]|uniref:Putative oxidoreductase n=1 Tax=Ulvibacter antarcticus TaxID=442714 RepID=A0A3L9YU86_9FLAO|nr:SDR family NAD(P)-dependent oxidoreductase [Ulvibacter antarcticus]RMA58022.1 putative oxidoreductase [Ulvibacter antarcticus]
MKDKIIVITGGSKGIGRALVAQLASDNTLIICGRTQKSLDRCKKEFPSIYTVKADISKETGRDKLVEFVKDHFGSMDVLINNAGVSSFTDLSEVIAIEKSHDMEINFEGTVILTAQCIPLLRKSKDASIVVVTSILAKVPVYVLPLYSASKAALHSYCISLREQLKNISVIEVLPPLVDTDFTKDIVSNSKMNPEKVASDIINGLERKKKEIYPGVAKTANVMNLFFPKKIAKIVNNP